MKNTLIFTCMVFTLLLTACGIHQETVSAVGTDRASENHMSTVADITAEATGSIEGTGENPAIRETAADAQAVSSGPQENGDAAAVSLTIGGQVYQARFYDNKTAKALMEQMPMELDMQELHGNEKYYYLPDSLPTDTENIGSIHAGDIMLFGSDCLVLFYEDFQTTFDYTRIGYLEEPAGLSDTLGSGSVKVSFDRAG